MANFRLLRLLLGDLEMGAASSALAGGIAAGTLILSTLTLSPWERARGEFGSSGGQSSLGGNPQRSFCWDGGIPSSFSIIICRSVKVLVEVRMRWEFFPSEEVTLIFLCPLGREEGEGGEGLVEEVLSVADIWRENYENYIYDKCSSVTLEFYF